MDINWAKPAFEVYKNRETLQEIWKAWLARFTAKNLRIAVTGAAGVGKTVLVDHLTGNAFRQGYTPPGRSVGAEKVTVGSGSKRFLLTIAPGQASPQRLESLDELFGGKEPCEGVIHVVANGFATSRETLTGEIVVEEGVESIEQYQQHMHEKELNDLEDVCAQIRTSHRKHRRPKWMLVAVDKLDLFSKGAALTAARQRYRFDPESPFVIQLQLLVGQIGSDFFSWDTVPVCGWLENFTWNGRIRSTKLTDAERDDFLKQFLKFLEAYCG